MVVFPAFSSRDWFYRLHMIETLDPPHSHTFFHFSLMGWRILEHDDFILNFGLPATQHTGLSSATALRAVGNKGQDQKFWDSSSAIPRCFSDLTPSSLRGVPDGQPSLSSLWLSGAGVLTAHPQGQQCGGRLWQPLLNQHLSIFSQTLGLEKQAEGQPGAWRHCHMTYSAWNHGKSH